MRHGPQSGGLRRRSTGFDLDEPLQPFIVATIGWLTEECSLFSAFLESLGVEMLFVIRLRRHRIRLDSQFRGWAVLLQLAVIPCSSPAVAESVVLFAAEQEVTTEAIQEGAMLSQVQRLRRSPRRARFPRLVLDSGRSDSGRTAARKLRAIAGDPANESRPRRVIPFFDFVPRP